MTTGCLHNIASARRVLARRGASSMLGTVYTCITMRKVCMMKFFVSSGQLAWGGPWVLGVSKSSPRSAMQSMPFNMQ